MVILLFWQCQLCHLFCDGESTEEVHEHSFSVDLFKLTLLLFVFLTRVLATVQIYTSFSL